MNYEILLFLARANAWIQDGHRYESPVRPDRLLWLSPDTISRKPADGPPTNVLFDPIVVGGSWDQDLSPIEDDIVYQAFHSRFVEDKRWEETGYLEFLATDVSEHGGVTTADAKERCAKLDRLYESIRQHGYRTQAELERDGGLVDGLSASRLPPIFREITVNLTREGEFVWNGGIHRLVIAKLLDIEEIPVRINVRHPQWQAIREEVYTTRNRPEYHDHKDIRYLLDS